MSIETPYADIIENFRCVVCYELADNSVECLLCGNVFCKGCVFNIKCPLCRNSSTYKDSFFARRIIDSLPVSCEACKTTTTRGGLLDHQRQCDERIFHCKISLCSFQGKKKEFEEHLHQNHSDSLLNEFDYKISNTKSNTLNLFNGKINAKGKQARRGTSGRFHCGEPSDINCGSCDGRCGPNSGCQCTSCMKLDIEFNNLPDGYVYNHDGVLCQLVKDKFFCGIRLGNAVFCEPEHHSCTPCGRLSSVKRAVSFITDLIENKKENKLN